MHVKIESHLKHIHVACAVIERDGLVLAAQRSAAMSLPLKWEFPGGKLEPLESAPECLKRELLEELGIEITTGTPLSLTNYSYPAISVTLHPFICEIIAGEPTLHEHAGIVWLAPEALLGLDWAEADGPILHEYLRHHVNQPASPSPTLSGAVSM